MPVVRHIGFTYYVRDHDPELIEDHLDLNARICQAPTPVCPAHGRRVVAWNPNACGHAASSAVCFRQQSTPGQMTAWVLPAG